MHLRSLFLATLMVFGISLPLQAQDDFEYWPDTNYDPAIPTVFEVLGYQPGEVIAFTQDPTVRAYLDGLNVMLMNAIFRGAVHARPAR